MDGSIEMDNPLSVKIQNIPQSSTVRIADVATRLRRQGKHVIDLSAGRSSEHTAVRICDAAKQAMDVGQTHQTPAKGTAEFLSIVSEKLDRENGLIYDFETEITATLGCKNGLVLALFSILDPDDEVIIEDPCFVSYEPTINLCGGRGVPVTLARSREYKWSFEELESAITEKTKAILFCSPHNPLGTVHNAEDLQVIADIAIKHNLVVIADEIYEAVTWGGRKHIPIASLPDMRDRTIGLMGMTKSYSMGGWRIGYAYAPAGVIAAMEKVQQHITTCPSSIAQAAAGFALSEEMTMEMGIVWKEWEARCEFMANSLNRLDKLSCAVPQAGYYIWLDVSATGQTSTEFSNGLLNKHNVMVVPGITFGPSADDFVRLTAVKSWDDINEAVENIEKYIAAMT